MSKQILTEADIALLGSTIGQAMATAQANVQAQRRPVRSVSPATVFKAVAEVSGNDAPDLTPFHPNIYGRYSIFDCCSTGDIIGLQVETTGLMEWLGFRPNKYYSRRVDFLSWIGPQGMAGAGTITKGNTAPCDDPYKWEFGTCGYDMKHTSWYSRGGQALDPHTIVQERCETSPRYRVNGVQISDDVEWQMNGAMTVLQQDIRWGIIHGSHLNAYQMNGLEALIKTGYTDDNGDLCPEVDSILLDWLCDDLDGTSNGLGNFFDYLDEVVTEIEYRNQRLGGIAETDMILLTNRFLATCLLDAYACYTTCGVTTDNDVTDQALRAQQRQMRMSLNGGPLYDGAQAVGFIQLKSGRRLPIMVEDYLNISKHANGNHCTDVYLLTRRIGNRDVLYGEYLDLRVWEGRIKAQLPAFGARADAAGRFAIKGKEDNFCIELIMGTSPEIYLAAPWSQVRISNVGCARKRAPKSGNVFQPEYLPTGRPLHAAPEAIAEP